MDLIPAAIFGFISILILIWVLWALLHKKKVPLEPKPLWDHAANVYFTKRYDVPRVATSRRITPIIKSRAPIPVQNSDNSSDLLLAASAGYLLGSLTNTDRSEDSFSGGGGESGGAGASGSWDSSSSDSSSSSSSSSE